MSREGPASLLKFHLNVAAARHDMRQALEFFLWLRGVEDQPKDGRIAPGDARSLLGPRPRQRGFVHFADPFQFARI